MTASLYGYEKLDRMLQNALESGFFAGAAAAICSPEKILWNWRDGLRQKEPEALPLLENTAFDLASLTKIVGTTLCAARLYDRGLLDFEAPLCEYLENTGSFANCTIRQMLTHTAGFVAEERLWDRLTKPAETPDYILHSASAYPAGTKTVYSCFGFIILGAVIEAVTKKKLARVCKDEVFKPLVMNHTCFNPRQSDFPDGFAATEYDEISGKMLCGTVHDENARFLGGAAGNAGIFSTSGDMVKLAHMLLNEGFLPGAKRYLNAETVTLLHTNLTTGMQEARGLGFKLAHYNAEQFAGTRLSGGSFGHTGFTGTSLLIDPERKLGIILLTNRVHPSREEKRLIDFRGHFHDAVAELTDTGYT